MVYRNSLINTPTIHVYAYTTLPIKWRTRSWIYVQGLLRAHADPDADCHTWETWTLSEVSDQGTLAHIVAFSAYCIAALFAWLDVLQVQLGLGFRV